MSLLCDETGEDIIFGMPLFAATREDVSDFYALSEEALSQIPASERRLGPLKADEPGKDIHASRSTRNLNGSYTTIGFRLGMYLFSISQETAEQYLPTHTRHRMRDAA